MTILSVLGLSFAFVATPFRQNAFDNNKWKKWSN